MQLDSDVRRPMVRSSASKANLKALQKSLQEKQRRKKKTAASALLSAVVGGAVVMQYIFHI